jgi:primosomal protein N' (replication factor Y) (superfamily II helicase)
VSGQDTSSPVRSVRSVRVLPDEAAIGKVFDYSVPSDLPGGHLVTIGSEVRVELNGRRVGGWVVATNVNPPAGVVLRPIAKVRGLGPPQQVVDLAMWTAWRWGGRPAQVLRFASPPRAIRMLPSAHAQAALKPTTADDALTPLGLLAANRGGVQLIQTPPATDRFPLLEHLAVAGGVHGALIVAPSLVQAQVLARRLRRLGHRVALLPDDWALAAAGGVIVIGARAAAFAPIAEPGIVVVIDEHDESHQDERMPTWHVREVCIERARRLGIPCVLTSPVPTAVAVDAIGHSPILRPDRRTERAGWGAVQVIDRSTEEPGRSGLISGAIVEPLRNADRVVCVLNRTGRARMMACVACGSVAECEVCSAAVRQTGTEAVLSCPRCPASRPTVCLHCGGSRMKNLRMGTARAREELEAMALRPVGEVTADTEEVPDTPVLVGTEAVLHRIDSATVVVFLDLDAELFAPRQQAQEHALALLARATRLVAGSRRNPARSALAMIGSGTSTGATPLVASTPRVIIQTRQPIHPAIRAAVAADPGILTASQAPMREALRLPPHAALALISGEAAAEWAGTMRADQAGSVQVTGPDDGRYLVRAADHTLLADAIARVDENRPPGRVRIEVDPLHL